MADSNLTLVSLRGGISYTPRGGGGGGDNTHYLEFLALVNMQVHSLPLALALCNSSQICHGTSWLHQLSGFNLYVYVRPPRRIPGFRYPN